MTLGDTLDYLLRQPLLSLAMLAILLAIGGGMLRGALPKTGALLRGLGNLGLVAALLLTIAQVTRFTTGNDLALPQVGMPTQSVSGGETRVEMDRDGHFWIKAQLNGASHRFLVDTGATLTAISEGTAIDAQVPSKSLRQTMRLRTANGTVEAELVSLDDMRFGNIVARDLDAVVAPGLGDTNVLGMNFLSRLHGWRVEGRTLVLVPRAVEPAI
jgi:aspartyl protease family protein